MNTSVSLAACCREGEEDYFCSLAACCQEGEEGYPSILGGIFHPHLLFPFRLFRPQHDRDRHHGHEHGLLNEHEHDHEHEHGHEHEHRSKGSAACTERQVVCLDPECDLWSQ